MFYLDIFTCINLKELMYWKEPNHTSLTPVTGFLQKSIIFRAPFKNVALYVQSVLLMLWAWGVCVLCAYLIFLKCMRSSWMTAHTIVRRDWGMSERRGWQRSGESLREVNKQPKPRDRQKETQGDEDKPDFNIFSQLRHKTNVCLYWSCQRRPKHPHSKNTLKPRKTNHHP